MKTENRKEKETHELIFSWLSWPAALLVGAYARHNGGDDDGVAQHSGHTPKTRLTETCSLAWLPCTSLILDTHVMISNIDTCQNKVSGDKYHVIILWAQVHSSLNRKPHRKVTKLKSTFYLFLG